MARFRRWLTCFRWRHFKAGDLVFFSSDGATPNHVGVYLGENRFFHAEKRAGRVIITDLNQPWYVKHFLGARRVVGAGKVNLPRKTWSGRRALAESAQDSAGANFKW